MTPCELVNLVSALTCTIVNCVEDTDQLELLASVFSTLGDSLETYTTYQQIFCNRDSSGCSSEDEGSCKC